jgi:hypothetical protein
MQVLQANSLALSGCVECPQQQPQQHAAMAVTIHQGVAGAALVVCCQWDCRGRKGGVEEADQIVLAPDP